MKKQFWEAAFFQELGNSPATFEASRWVDFYGCLPGNGWVGDTFDGLSLSLFADADFSGCSKSLRSTSGSHMHIQGGHTRFPLFGGGKRQGCISHPTPEAETLNPKP